MSDHASAEEGAMPAETPSSTLEQLRFMYFRTLAFSSIVVFVNQKFAPQVAQLFRGLLEQFGATTVNEAQLRTDLETRESAFRIAEHGVPNPHIPQLSAAIDFVIQRGLVLQRARRGGRGPATIGQKVSELLLIIAGMKAMAALLSLSAGPKEAEILGVFRIVKSAQFSLQTQVGSEAAIGFAVEQTMDYADAATRANFPGASCAFAMLRARAEDLRQALQS